MSAILRKGWCPGALSPMLSGDGYLVRLRLTNGVLSFERARALADLARRFGNGLFDLSARANLQMRGVGAAVLAPLQAELAALRLLDGSAADKRQQPRFQSEVRFPQLAVVDIFNPLPDARLAAVLVPAGPQMPVIEAKHLRRKPGGDMHSVGDVADGNGVLRPAWVEPRPHGPRHVAVER